MSYSTGTQGGPIELLDIKHHFLQAHNSRILMGKKSSAGGRKPTRMSKELMGNLKGKKESL